MISRIRRLLHWNRVHGKPVDSATRRDFRTRLAELRTQLRENSTITPRDGFEDEYREKRQTLEEVAALYEHIVRGEIDEPEALRVISELLDRLNSINDRIDVKFEVEVKSDIRERLNETARLLKDFEIHRTNKQLTLCHEEFGKLIDLLKEDIRNYQLFLVDRISEGELQTRLQATREPTTRKIELIDHLLKMSGMQLPAKPN